MKIIENIEEETMSSPVTAAIAPSSPEIFAGNVDGDYCGKHVNGIRESDDVLDNDDLEMAIDKQLEAIQAEEEDGDKIEPKETNGDKIEPDTMNGDKIEPNGTSNDKIELDESNSVKLESEETNGDKIDSSEVVDENVDNVVKEEMSSSEVVAPKSECPEAHDVKISVDDVGEEISSDNGVGEKSEPGEGEGDKSGDSEKKSDKVGGETGCENDEEKLATSDNLDVVVVEGEKSAENAKVDSHDGPLEKLELGDDNASGDKSVGENISKKTISNAGEAMEVVESTSDKESKVDGEESPKKPEIRLEACDDTSSETSDVEDKDEPKKSEEPKINYQDALSELSMIAQSGRKINDDDSKSSKTLGNKRMSSTELTNESSKKVKLDSDNMDSIQSPSSDSAKMEIKQCLKKMSKVELEDILAGKMVDLIASRSEIGELRRKCDAYEAANEKWKRKTQLLQKMCQDLNTVMKRYITDVQVKPAGAAAPIKITRSVGLQVMTDRRKAVAPKSAQAGPQKAQLTPPQKPQAPAQQLNGLQATIASLKPIVPAPQKTPITIAPAKALQALPPSVSVTTSVPAVVAPKKVMDVVDLSDEDDDLRPVTANKQQQPANPVKLVQRAPQFVVVGQQQPPANRIVGQYTPRSTIIQANNVPAVRKFINFKHPAPLPEPPTFQATNPLWKRSPPRPTLKISRLNSGIVLSWNMVFSSTDHALISTYQIYAYQESGMQAPSASLWKKVGDVKALPLPMACTLTQFSKGNKYHFAVRAQDMHMRVGIFSEAQSIALT